MASKKLTWLPDTWDLVFSIKTFMAAMLALFIALCFDLPNPYWAVTTVYIVAHPLSGASTSKAVYRLVGTAAGGAMSILLVPNLVNAPELLTLAIALWVAGCLAVSLLDRSPRSYGFMLAGYTAALTSFPLVDNPGAVFTYTTSRVIEIFVAIICAAVINRVVFPRHAGPVLTARIDAWLNDASVLITAALDRQPKDPALMRTSRRLAAEAVDIRMFTTHVSYDTSTHSDLVGASRELQGLMIMLLPVVSGLVDVDVALARTEYEHKSAIKKLIADTADWMRTKEPMSAERYSDFLAPLQGLEVEARGSTTWQCLLVLDFAARLRELLEIWNECVGLRQDIASGSRSARRMRTAGFAQATTRPIHKDYGMALFSGFSAALAIVLGTIFWIMTGWSSGAGAPLIAGILICFFAAMDNPTPMIRKFMIFSMVAIVLSFVFVFAVMPVLSGFSSLVLALSFLFLPLGVLIARPSTFLLGMALSANIPTMLTLQSRPSFDLGSFLNTNLATILGTIMAIGIAAVVRSVGAEWSARRLLKAAWTDIAGVARKSQRRDPQALLYTMLDRLSLMVPRLASIAEGSAVIQADMLKDMRVGIAVIDLQAYKGLLLADQRAAVDNVLDAVASCYTERRRSPETQPASSFLEAVDAAIDAVRDPVRSSAARKILMALVALRHNLFPDADQLQDIEAPALRAAAE
jgi:uncharacterized membrane protein YccC